MSVDYYLVCEDEKIYMPIFTMNLGGCWLPYKNWVFDFILRAGYGKIEFVHEDKSPSSDDGWEFINSWNEYKKEGKTPMSEYNQAVYLADKVLKTPYRDPDDDMSVLARQFLRAIEPSSGRAPNNRGYDREGGEVNSVQAILNVRCPRWLR